MFFFFLEHDLTPKLMHELKPQIYKTGKVRGWELDAVMILRRCTKREFLRISGGVPWEGGSHSRVGGTALSEGPLG